MPTRAEIVIRFSTMSGEMPTSRKLGKSSGITQLDTSIISPKASMMNQASLHRTSADRDQLAVAPESVSSAGA